MPSPAAILDVDGTLVDSNDAHARAWMEAFGEAGVEVSYDRVRRAIGMGGDKLMPHVSGLSEESAQGRRISDRRSEIFTSRYLPHLRPFPHVRELVSRLADDGFTIVVASSAKQDELGPLLEIAGVADLIESRTSSDDAEESKPDPDIVTAALGESGAPRHAAIMLGDTPYDVEAAQRAGVQVVALESGGWTRGELAGAAEIYADAADLYARYPASLFARMAQQSRREAGWHRPRVPAWWLAAPLIGLGVLGLLVVAQAARRRRDRGYIVRGDTPRDADYAETGSRRPNLTPRDREALRRLIERTS
jgi:HAD superfamily hydrolase (TIGR01509 family)